MRYGLFIGLALVALGFSATPSAFSAATAIYQWKDNRGGLFFTDDLNQIPRQYRRPPHLQIVPGTLPALPEESKPAAKTAEKSADKNKDAAKEKTDDKSAQEKKAVVNEAIGLFSNEVQNDAVFAQMMPNLTSGNKIAAYIMQTLPAKKTLVEKLAKFEAPVLVEVASFLKQNIAADEAITPHALNIVHKVSVVIARIKQELPVKSDFLEKLKLEATAEPASKTAMDADAKEGEKKVAAKEEGAKMEPDGSGDRQASPLDVSEKKPASPE